MASRDSVLHRVRAYFVTKRPQLVYERLKGEERLLLDAVISCVFSHSNKAHGERVKNDILVLAFIASEVPWHVLIGVGPANDLTRVRFADLLLHLARACCTALDGDTASGSGHGNGRDIMSDAKQRPHERSSLMLCSVFFVLCVRACIEIG